MSLPPFAGHFDHAPVIWNGLLRVRARGLPDWRATLLAQVSIAALGHAIHTWGRRASGASGDLDALIVQAFADLREFSSADIVPGPSAG